MQIDGEERGRLDGVPDPQPNPGSREQPTSQGQAGVGTFEFNYPTIVSLLYIGGWLTGGVSAIVGVVLAYVWRGESKEEWEASHYQYLINTFWIGLIGSVISIVLMIVLIGVLLIIAVAVLVIVRSVLSLINAQKHEPMPNPGTLLA